MKLRTIIKRNKHLILNGRICFCYFHTKKVDTILIEHLSEEALDEKWYSSEWWIESGDLCLMRGR